MIEEIPTNKEDSSSIESLIAESLAASEEILKSCENLKILAQKNIDTAKKILSERDEAIAGFKKGLKRAIDQGNTEEQTKIQALFDIYEKDGNVDSLLEMINDGMKTIKECDTNIIDTKNDIEKINQIILQEKK